MTKAGIDAHYLNPKLAAIYDLDSPWSEDRDFYISLAGHEPRSILDLGCGTGLLCDAYAARGHHVTGVDPSAAMLDIARRKPHGKSVEWVQSPAQSFESGKRFDLIIMTGHAFQVLLDDNDISATFQVMRTHLNDGGLVVFESRNPRVDWASNWQYEMTFETSFGTLRETRHFLHWDEDCMTFQLLYSFPDETLSSTSELRFLSHDDIAKRAAAVGLTVHQLFGDWNKQAFDEASSAEMIFVLSPTTGKGSRE